MLTKSFHSRNPQPCPKVLGYSHASAVVPVLPDALVSSLHRPRAIAHLDTALTPTRGLSFLLLHPLRIARDHP